MTHSSSAYGVDTTDQEDRPQDDRPSVVYETSSEEFNEGATTSEEFNEGATASEELDEGATAPSSEHDSELEEVLTPISEHEVLEEKSKASHAVDVANRLDPQTSQTTSLLSNPERPSATLFPGNNRWVRNTTGASTYYLNQSSGDSFRTKVVSWALALGMLPILVVGTVTYFSGQSIQRQLSEIQPTEIKELDETERAIQQQLPTLLIGTGITAILVGAIAAWLAYRVATPVHKAAQVSSQMLNKIRPGLGEQDSIGVNVLSQLEYNIQALEGYIPGLLEQQDSEIEQLQMLNFITNRIRTSLSEEDVLSATVEEARKVLKADRVFVYGFDQDWYGTIIAESVVPGLPKALWAEIRDPCFAENYVEKYQAGHVQVVNNIYEAGLTDCHIAQLEPFGIKANLVVPILREHKLFGLLIANQCSQPRVWQDVEVKLFAQVASQVGFALEHARLLVQVENINQTTKAYSEQALQEYEVLQQRLSQLSVDSDNVVELFGSEANAAIASTRDQIHEMAAAANQVHQIINDITQTQEQAQITTQESQAAMAETFDHLQSLNQLVETVERSIQPLQQPTQQLGELINLMGHVASQVQLQAMNAALEAARAGSAGQSFAEIAEKIHGLSRQLDATLMDVKPLFEHVQTTAQSAISDITTGKNTIAGKTQRLDDTQSRLDNLNHSQQRLLDLTQQISVMVTHQVELSMSGHQNLDHLTSSTLSATEQSVKVAEVVQQLVAEVDI